MRITYLGHSGFLAEWEDTICLFDWSEGELPALAPDRKLYVFASHAHGDHFREAIFELGKKNLQPTFVLSSDIQAALPEGTAGKVIRLAPGCRRLIAGGRRGVLTVRTLCSTDAGVAFLVNYAGRTIYHAGDLHWWAWPDDTPAEERAMKNRFFQEITILKGITLDAAFLPLDPRLEEHFWWGFDAMMRTADIQNAFPMHMWDDYETVDRLRRLDVSEPYRDRIMEVCAAGQEFDI